MPRTPDRDLSSCDPCFARATYASLGRPVLRSGDPCFPRTTRAPVRQPARPSDRARVVRATGCIVGRSRVLRAALSLFRGRSRGSRQGRLLRAISTGRTRATRDRRTVFGSGESRVEPANAADPALRSPIRRFGGCVHATSVPAASIPPASSSYCCARRVSCPGRTFPGLDATLRPSLEPARVLSPRDTEKFYNLLFIRTKMS